MSTEWHCIVSTTVFNTHTRLLSNCLLIRQTYMWLLFLLHIFSISVLFSFVFRVFPLEFEPFGPEGHFLLKGPDVIMLWEVAWQSHDDTHLTHNSQLTEKRLSVGQYTQGGFHVFTLITQPKISETHKHLSPGNVSISTVVGGHSCEWQASLRVSNSPNIQ